MMGAQHGHKMASSMRGVIVARSNVTLPINLSVPMALFVSQWHALHGANPRPGAALRWIGTPAVRSAPVDVARNLAQRCATHL